MEENAAKDEMIKDLIEMSCKTFLIMGDVYLKCFSEHLISRSEMQIILSRVDKWFTEINGDLERVLQMYDAKDPISLVQLGDIVQNTAENYRYMEQFGHRFSALCSRRKAKGNWSDEAEALFEKS